MTKYKTWKEYLASEQDAYLDEENRADCDVQYRVGGFIIDGQSNIGAYAVTTTDGQLIGIYVSSLYSKSAQITEVYVALGLMTEENYRDFYGPDSDYYED